MSMPALTTTLTATTPGSSSSPINLELDYLVADWTMSLSAVVSPETTGSIVVQSSTDGFVSDIRAVDVFEAVSGTGDKGNLIHAPDIRAYQRSLSARVGIVNAALRLHLQAISRFNPSVVAKLTLQINELLVA
jgi:hypothetical protein